MSAPRAPSSDARVVVVGAGPAALSLAVGLACHDQADDLEVLDPSGGWLTAWHRRFAAQGITHLRSPAVHHPHPDPFALLGACGTPDLVRSGGTSLPTTGAFARFCDALVADHRLSDRVTPTAATAVTVDHEGAPSVTLADGSTRRPQRLVLAGNVRRPQVPSALRPWCDRDPRVVGTERAHVDDAPTDGHLVVVGGGLSAAHLALGAVDRGTQVTLLARRRLRVRRFDTHPTWLGPKKRRPFEAEPDPAVRRRTIDQARGGGSVPPAIRRRLEACEQAGRLTLRTRAEVTDLLEDGDRLALTLDGGDRLVADRVWVATGGAVDVTHDPLCAGLREARPVPVHDGMVDLGADLTWPGTRVHLVGGAASLVLGPTAGNLVGQRRAAIRIRAALDGEDPALADRLRTGRGACPAAPLRTPELASAAR